VSAGVHDVGMQDPRLVASRQWNLVDGTPIVSPKNCGLTEVSARIERVVD
jgi:hypothetical protein